MKKNKMLRTASAMLILTIITISIIGGALAKYTTEATGSDTAVVAKFGVTATVTGDLFGKIYKEASTDPATDGNTIIDSGNGTVQSKDTTDVVAPGTENKTGMSLSVKGTPEVSTQVSLTARDDYANSDIYLAPGDYGVMVEYTGEVNDAGDFYTLEDNKYKKISSAPTGGTKVYQLQQKANVEGDADYHPLKWYVDYAGASSNFVTFGDNGESIINAIATKFGKTDGTDEIPSSGPGEEYNLSATVGWEWSFVGNDGADTILGNMIAAAPESLNNRPAPITVVKKQDDGKYVAVTYAVGDSVDDTRKIVYAKVDDETVACLTAAFNVSLKVEQVD